LLEKILEQRNDLLSQVESLRASAKKLAGQFSNSSTQNAPDIREEARAVKARIQVLELAHQECESKLRDFLLAVPNLPDDRLPDGDSELFSVEVRSWGTQPAFDFEPMDHVEVGTALGILDLGRATKIAGPRFSVLRGAGAELERSLASYLLNLHTRRHGYKEVSVPALVSRATMTGTGQLPKFEEDLFRTGVGDRELFLIPTAEVPLTNLHAHEILSPSDLPIAYTAQTLCFRSEAGSYGRDTRGLIRQHQFSKIELVRIVPEDEADTQLTLMLEHAETALRELGLNYRVVRLAAGDIGFSAQYTYDIEVWLPGQSAYREVSSVSNCGTFQSRRAGIRVRSASGKKVYPATLNGSALPLGRTIAAILEQFQEPDGSVRVPEVLRSYMGRDTIHSEHRPG
jgi:seryl-tRNA synthetase